MDYLSAVTIGPFDKKNYSLQYQKLKFKQIIIVAIVFSCIQFVLIALPQLLFVPKNVTFIWNSMSDELAQYLEKEPFTKIAIKNGQLETDLIPQPYTITRSGANSQVMVTIDSSDKTNLTTINKLPEKTVGIFITKKDLYVRTSNQAINTISYAFIFGDRTIEMSKEQVISFLQKGAAFDQTLQYFEKIGPISVIVTFLVYSFILFSLNAIIRLFLITCTLATVLLLMTKKGQKKQFPTVMKMSVFGAIGVWYGTTFIGACASYFSTTGTYVAALLFVPVFIFFIQLISIALKEIGPDNSKPSKT